MLSIKAAASEFLANKRIAVTGVSRKPESHGSNVVYCRLREHCYEVFAVNPHADEVEGDPCHLDLKSIPGGVDAVVIGTSPEIAESTIREVRGARHQARLDASVIRNRQRVGRWPPNSAGGGASASSMGAAR